MPIGNLLEQVFLMAVGVSAFVGIYGFILYRNSWRWRKLSQFYAASAHVKPIKQRWTNMVLHGAGAWNNYAGITLIGVNERGITLKILPPFSPFHHPIFVPYDEATIIPTRWLFQNAFEIKLRQETELHIVINKKTAQWIENQRVTFNVPCHDYGLKMGNDL